MKCLEEEHTSLLSHLAENKGILSPVRQMPPEVLGEIFSWTLPSIEALRQEHFSVADGPWLLTPVSIHWRAIAFSIPSLWMLVVINFAREFLYPLSMVKSQIQRAHLLKIHFYGGQEQPSRPQVEMFECLAEHSSCWQELSIGLTSDLAPHLAGLRGCLPRLCRLWIEWDGLESQAGVQSIDWLERAPSL
ncbi:hypothetical protein C8R44DRAFT_848131, partial [Mycena epipterygia]